MKISTLLKVDTNLVFYSPTLGGVRQAYVDGLKDGSMVGTDIYGAAMTPDAAVEAFLYMADWTVDTETRDAVYRNLEIAPIMVSLVRAEMIDVGLADPVATMAKLSDVIATVNMGMFREAEALFGLVVPDAFLTEARIGRYQEALSASDAINYTS